MSSIRLTVCGAVLGLVALAAATGPNPGKDLFVRRCSGCHSLDANKEGPRLRGVFGRKAGTVAGFPYSEELRKSGITWDAVTLDKWLENTESVVPSNDMEFRVTNPDERTALLAYLKSLTGPQ